MRHIKFAGRNTVEIAEDFLVSQNVPGKIDFYELGQSGYTVTQAEMRELLPYLQAFAETGELPRPPEPEKTPLEKLLERVNAVPRPRIVEDKSWVVDNGMLILRHSSATIYTSMATVMLDRGGATMAEVIASIHDIRALADHVDAVADIVRKHYDDEALCAALNAVPGKPKELSAYRWEREAHGVSIALGSGDFRMSLSSDGSELYFTEFALNAYASAIRAALKEFHATSTTR